jgi:hypothetical protein
MAKKKRKGRKTSKWSAAKRKAYKSAKRALINRFNKM